MQYTIALGPKRPKIYVKGPTHRATLCTRSTCSSSIIRRTTYIILTWNAPKEAIEDKIIPSSADYKKNETTWMAKEKWRAKKKQQRICVSWVWWHVAAFVCDKRRSQSSQPVRARFEYAIHGLSHNSHKLFTTFFFSTGFRCTFTHLVLLSPSASSVSIDSEARALRMNTCILCI